MLRMNSQCLKVADQVVRFGLLVCELLFVIAWVLRLMYKTRRGRQGYWDAEL
jgi:uncharacterized membrane protein (DUF485 family)